MGGSIFTSFSGSQCVLCNTHIISPSLSLVWIRAQLLWSLVVTARLRRGGTRGAFGPSPLLSNDMLDIFPKRIMGCEPLRLTDMCRPPTPPIILGIEARRFCTGLKTIENLEFRLPLTGESVKRRDRRTRKTCI